MGEVQLPAGEFPCRDHMDREGLHAEKGAVSPGAQPPAQRGSGTYKTSRMGGGVRCVKPPCFGVVCQQHCITKTLVTHRCPLSKHTTISQMQRKYGHPFPTTTCAANS